MSTETPTRKDEAPGSPQTEGLSDQEIQHRDSATGSPAEPVLLAKLEASLQAEFALAGYELQKMRDGSFVVAKWGMVRALNSLVMQSRSPSRPGCAMHDVLTDLNVTFPKLRTRPLAEFSATLAHVGGIWTGTDGSTMPGTDEPIFESIDPDPAVYDGFVHQGFVAWLAARGWGYECYDAGTFFLVPLSYFDQSEVRHG